MFYAHYTPGGRNHGYNLLYVNTETERGLDGEINLDVYVSEKVHRPIYDYQD